jgi:hypothetical protein
VFPHAREKPSPDEMFSPICLIKMKGVVMAATKQRLLRAKTVERRTPCILCFTT